jgi:pyridoxamine 5'-phosphate oxidase
MVGRREAAVNDRHPVAPAAMTARVQYEVPGLDLDSVNPAPLEQFRLWFVDAVAASIPEPNAMGLATTGPGGPAIRVVLAKSVDADGIRFYTNLRSAKAAEIAYDDRVALVSSWITLHRQVRFSGRAEVLPEHEADEYFRTRPRGAQIGAWASPQSEPIESREVLRERVAQVAARYPGDTLIPRPPEWGGYLVRPSLVEFWQGQPSRLHDRLEFRASGPAAGMDDPRAWQIRRLAP